MSSAPSSRSTTPVPDALFPGIPTAPRLPPELIQHILSYLPQRDRRQVALASRAFYAHASQAGLQIHINCDWSFFRAHAFERSLKKLDLVLAQATTPCAWNLIVRAAVDPPRNDIQTAAFQHAINLLGASIRSALRNLVQLRCSFSHLEADEGFSAWPAPKLRTLTLTDHRTGLTVLVPSPLFNGVAPELRKLSLILTDTESMCAWQPNAAFQGITHLKLTTQSVPHRLRLEPLFSALRVLVIDACNALEKRIVDLRGLELRHFALAGNIELLGDASLELLSTIPIFEYRTDDVAPESIWCAKDDQLYAFAERCGADPGVSVGPRDGSWRRTIVSTFLRQGALPLEEIPRLGSTLASLTIEESLVTAFVQADIVLSTLRELIVDVTTARDLYDPFDRLHFAFPRVCCPALARLVLLCLPAVNAFSVRVSPDKVVCLGRALDLCDARPLLVLAGCTWTRIPSPPAETELLELFSNMGDEGPVEANMPTYYDTCRYSGYLDTSGWE